MGLMDFIKGELLEVIEWTDDSRDTLSFRFPDDDKAIKNGAQLIVASLARQYRQRPASGSAAAPQLGQWSPPASIVIGLP